MIPVNSSAPSGKNDREQLEGGQKPFETETNPPLERSPDRGLQDMPDEILLKIISFIFTHSSEEQLNSRSELEKAASSLNALAGVNQRLRQIAKDRYTIRMVVRNSLEAFGSLGKLSSNGNFSNVLSLDLDLLEGGFNLYFKEPNNKFSKIFSLAQEVKKLAFDLVKEANMVFKREDLLPAVWCAIIIRDFEEERFRFVTGGFDLLVSFSHVLICTPFHFIKIEDNGSEARPLEGRTDLPSLAIAEVLINHFQAAFVSAFFDPIEDPYYELPKPNSPVCHIRRVTAGELIRVGGFASLKNGEGSQRVILRNQNSILYTISQIGRWWEGYVLETANSLYKNRGVPSHVAKMVKEGGVFCKR